MWRGRSWLRRLWRGLLVIALAGALTLAVLVVIIVRYGRIDRARSADVIIVLGAGSPGTERRARHAAILYQRGLAPAVVCSGGYRDAPDSPSEAERCAAQLIAAGVPAEAITREESSLNTVENARAAAALMRDRGWADAVLVTDDFHLWRAAWLFRREGVQVWPSPAQATQESMQPGEWAISVLREVGALGWHGKEALKDWLGDLIER